MTVNNITSSSESTSNYERFSFSWFIWIQNISRILSSIIASYICITLQTKWNNICVIIYWQYWQIWYACLYICCQKIRNLCKIHYIFKRSKFTIQLHQDIIYTNIKDNSFNYYYFVKQCLFSVMQTLSVSLYQFINDKT